MTRYLGGRHSYKVEVLPLSHPLAILPRISICPTQSDAYNTTRLRVHYIILTVPREIWDFTMYCFTKELNMTKRSYIRGNFYGNSTDTTHAKGQGIFDQVNFSVYLVIFYNRKNA